MSAKRRQAVRTAGHAPRQSSLDLGRIAPSARSLAVGFALAALALGCYAVGRWTPVFAVQSIEVVGLDQKAAAQVRAALHELKGKSLVGLRDDDVQRRVSALPEVLSARHDRSFPHTLVVFVRAERTVGVVRRGDESWLVSARGRVVARLRLGDRPALPRLWVAQSVSTGVGGFVSDPDTLRSIRTLALSVNASLPAIRTVRVDRRELTVVLRSGVELRLGDDSEIPLKLAIAATALPHMRLETSGETLYLDVSVPERPVAGAV